MALAQRIPTSSSPTRARLSGCSIPRVLRYKRVNRAKLGTGARPNSSSSNLTSLMLLKATYNLRATTHDPNLPHISTCAHTTSRSSTPPIPPWHTSTCPSATARISPALHNCATSPWSDVLSTHALQCQQTTKILSSLSPAADLIAASATPTMLLLSPPIIPIKVAMPDFLTPTITALHPTHVVLVENTLPTPDCHSPKLHALYIALSMSPGTAPRDSSEISTPR